MRVKCQRWLARPHAVEVPDVRIKANAFQRAEGGDPQEGVAKVERGVEGIGGRPRDTPGRWGDVTLRGDQVCPTRDVLPGGLPFDAKHRFEPVDGLQRSEVGSDAVGADMQSSRTFCLLVARGAQDELPCVLQFPRHDRARQLDSMRRIVMRPVLSQAKVRVGVKAAGGAGKETPGSGQPRRRLAVHGESPHQVVRDRHASERDDVVDPR